MRKNIHLLVLMFASASLWGKNSSDTLSYKTVLFKITDPNSATVSYLFGTHHAFGKSFFDSLSEANKALESCDLLIKENLNIPGETAEDIINERIATTEWNRFLGKEEFSFIENLFANSPTDFEKMTPTELYVFLNRYFNQYICLNKSPNDSSLTLDDYIGTKAVKRNMELYGLETTREQIEMINKDVEGMPRKIHKERLKSIIDIITTEDTKRCGETAWYSQMEIDYKLNEPCRNTLMLTDRNNEWLGSIRERLDSNNCFIAVGLSHLMYECGLINKLREFGYTIMPVEVN